MLQNPSQKLDFLLIERGQQVYSSCKLLKAEIDQIVLPVLDNIKDKRIVYMYRYRFSHGMIRRVKDNIVFIRDGLHNRRLNIKNLHIYHESVFALLSLYR